MEKWIFLGLIVSVVVAVPTPEVSNHDSLDCFQYDEFVSCLMIKINSAIARAARSSDIDIVNGVKFVRDSPMERSGKALQSEVDAMNELPRDLSDRTLKLISMFYDATTSFLKSHSLKVNIPEESISRSLDEGRAKVKKFILPLIAAAGLKIFAIAPIILGGLSLLVLKALFIGKIALLVAGILAFQRLFGGNGIGSNVGSIFSKNVQPTSAWYDGGAQNWSAGQTNTQGYYKRSFEDEKTAQKLAYSAHVEGNNN